MTVRKMGPQDARRRMRADAALLVCAYDSDEKFAQNRLNGAISLAELQSREDELDRERELIFYCD